MKQFAARWIDCVFSTMRTLVVLGGVLAGPITALGGDWPQILGPHRNGIADDEHLASQWPTGGPKTLWQRPVGNGFAGVAVAGGRAVLFHRVKDQELVEAMDAVSGKPLWNTGFPTNFRAQIVDDDGPRCVPLIHQDSVYLFGAGGNLHCVSLATGDKKWSRAVYQEFRASEGYFGAGSTPIVEGDKLLVNVGGDRAGAGLAAFSPSSGKTLWQATDEQASYSSPTAATIEGVRHVIFVTRYNVVSIDPDSGAVRFRFPFGMRGPTVNGATPLVIDGHVFVSASYGVGAVFAKVGKDNAKQTWASNDVMSSQYPTCVYKAGYLYGIDGRQDAGAATLRCIDPRAGKVMWTEKGFGMATLILADGKLVIVKTDGELVLADPSPERYRPLNRAHVFRSTTRALPALANGLLYVRDTATLKCVDLRDPATAK
ncbi:MAG: PQQ-binding-like beta-propeller repeat protein [Planctomycetes bacterium]|nr:PQQ-binding-like beta-propeller repeat protein [Planctomycetota bacterium]